MPETEGEDAPRNESCSIHSNRPSACREFLVSSPAEAAGAEATAGETPGADAGGPA